jgi:hypothetical protein
MMKTLKKSCENHETMSPCKIHGFQNAKMAQKKIHIYIYIYKFYTNDFFFFTYDVLMWSTYDLYLNQIYGIIVI